MLEKTPLHSQRGFRSSFARDYSKNMVSLSIDLRSEQRLLTLVRRLLGDVMGTHLGNAAMLAVLERTISKHCRDPFEQFCRNGRHGLPSITILEAEKIVFN